MQNNISYINAAIRNTFLSDDLIGNSSHDRGLVPHPAEESILILHSELLEELHEGNYFIVEVSNDPNASQETWLEGYVGYVQVTSSTPSLLYVGNAPYSFGYISVGCWAAGGSDPYNDVMASYVLSS